MTLRSLLQSKRGQLLDISIGDGGVVLHFVEDGDSMLTVVEDDYVIIDNKRIVPLTAIVTINI